MPDPSNSVALRLHPPEPTVSTDAELVAAIRRGDPGAARVLWERFAPLVHGLARRVLGPQSEIDDLVQDVFLRLYRSLHQLRAPELLRSFVVSVTMNDVRQELRRRKVRQWIRLTDTGSVPEAEAPGSASARTALLRFYAVLDQLGTEDRACFTLRHIEGLELADVASALGVSLATAKRRLERANDRVMRRVRRDPFLFDFLVTHHLMPQEPRGHG